MPNDRVVVLRSGPGTSEAEGALRLAEALLEQADVLALALIEDAVLIALKDGELPAQGQLRGLLDAGAPCVYLAEDLALRGFDADQSLPGCAPTGYDGLVDLMLADDARVAGAF
jgi:sulfur transfer complex TusBCD TusB component (DsrH family)